MQLENYFKNGKAYVWPETFMVMKSKKSHPYAFTNIIDKKEITVIIEESLYKKEDCIEAEPDWKILTFDMVLPFGLCGFLAKIAEKLADAGISILAISSYSTDHVLVKKRDLRATIEQLKKLGFEVKENS